MIRKLGEHKGRQELYKKQAPEMLENLRQVALIQSTESSNRIEGIVADDKRLRAIVEEKAKPANRPEAEIAGYRDVLNTIHQSHEHIPFTERVVLQLHRDLMKYAGADGGKWKAASERNNRRTCRMGRSVSGFSRRAASDRRSHADLTCTIR